MGQDNKLMFSKSVNDTSTDKNSKNIKKINNNQRIKIKQKLKEKYNISDEEAELVLVRIENKETNLGERRSSTQPANSKDEIPKNKPSLKSEINMNDVADSQKNIYGNRKSEQENNDSIVEDSSKISKKISKNNSDSKSKPIVKKSVSEGVLKSEGTQLKNKQDVDSLLSNIVPNYGQQISIELEHVNLTFEIIDDKIDTLKESFIRTIKRNKSKKSKFQVLTDISFKIYKGEKVGIIGYNGAGKSTLLKVITGIYPPDSGKVVSNGNISPLLSLGAGFDRNYSGRKNIYLNGAVLGYDKKFLKEKEQDIIEFSELGKFIDYPIKNYSSGMLAKLGFSIATMLNPDILIIDEILGVGDVTFRRKSGDKIKSLMDGKTTVLLVSHSIPQIRELCDKAIWIDDGKVREVGDVNEVCDHYLKDSEKASKKQLENIRFK